MNNKIREWLESFLYAFVVLLVLFFLCWPFQVSGSSMEFALRNGDRIAASRLASFLNIPERGDLVVCVFNVNGTKETVVKRVVALPGDHLQITDGTLYLNGVEWPEPYLGNTTTIGQTDMTLSNDEFFVLGDNRATSLDSRSLGPVKKSDIRAKVLARWYPFRDFVIYR